MEKSWLIGKVTAVTVFGDPSFTANQTFDQGTATSNGVSQVCASIRRGSFI
jgi:hypothetical protein